MNNGIPTRYIHSGKVLPGGMGEVLVCQDQVLEREVAIKFILNIENQHRLFDEIAALQVIRSKHVVQIYDVFLNEEDRRVGIVQEYISGDDLVSYIEEKEITIDDYLKILYQIICGISDLHDQDLIHRDIKPNNIKLDQSNIIKIFDFGLARFTGRNDSTLGFRGTLGFAAPELYNAGLVPLTSAVDIYSFGVISWFLSGQKLPQKLLSTPPNLKNLPSFSSLSLNIPPLISNVLDQSISENPQDRPHASEIKELIGSYLLFGKHRGLIINGTEQYILEKINQIIKLDVKNLGSIHIKYNGLHFMVDYVGGAVFINNIPAVNGQIIPRNCVITLGNFSVGAKRVFITFDISNPEVVL